MQLRLDAATTALEAASDLTRASAFFSRGISFEAPARLAVRDAVTTLGHSDEPTLREFALKARIAAPEDIRPQNDVEWVSALDSAAQHSSDLADALKQIAATTARTR